MKESLREEQAKVSTASLAILAAVAVAGVLYWTQAVLIPFVLALMIASVVSPVVDYQVLRLGLYRSVAVSVALLLVLTIVLLFALLIAYTGQQMISAAGRYAGHVDHLVDSLEQLIRRWNPKMNANEVIHSELDQFIQELKVSLPSVLTRTFGTTISLFTAIFLITIFVIFLLAGRNPYIVRQGMYAEIDGKIRGYISKKLLLSSMTGILVGLVLALLRLDLAVVFGLLAFVLNFIPSLGSVIATLLPLPLAFAQFGDQPWRVVAVVAFPGAIQMVIGNVLEPKVMGHEMKLHPVAILLTLSFWGLLWGPIGMLLAVPITAIVRIVLLRFETTQPIANLLAGELYGPLEPGGRAA